MRIASCHTMICGLLQVGPPLKSRHGAQLARQAGHGQALELCQSPKLIHTLLSAWPAAGQECRLAVLLACSTARGPGSPGHVMGCVDTCGMQGCTLLQGRAVQAARRAKKLACCIAAETVLQCHSVQHRLPFLQAASSSDGPASCLLSRLCAASAMQSNSWQTLHVSSVCHALQRLPGLTHLTNGPAAGHLRS